VSYLSGGQEEIWEGQGGLKKAFEKKVKKDFDRLKTVCIMAGSFAEKRRDRERSSARMRAVFLGSFGQMFFFWLRF
jgi:hypothetical protein